MSHDCTQSDWDDCAYCERLIDAAEERRGRREGGHRFDTW